jgi:hypothetical protein
MPTLDSSLRDQLATVIGKENAETGARAVAEAGARAAIEALAVHLPTPYAHLDAAAKALRNQLRARARQLGDAREVDGAHRIGRLVEQTAYEHWHRMLFARFLAENELLIHPQMGVAVSLSECAELAASEGAVDGWELAGRYASRMLPRVFRPDDALLAVRFALDDVKRLEALLDSLPGELFRASDSLGWCYQFWQAKRKREVNASEVKIGADELPAVTQLFTEPYMVQFLLHNTLGAWWVGAGRKLPLEMPYLRFLDDGTPAAGKFDGWPRLARELKVLDPCCGSGHFLVAAFEILVAFRMAEEGLSAPEACDAVLRDNLFGLEIDARCVQIAAFALAMAAWTYPGAGGYRALAPMNVACSGLAISAKKEEWERLGGDNPRLRAGMGRMWELFSEAPVLGSLIDPTRDPPDPMFTAGPDDVQPIIDRALLKSMENEDDLELTVAARGIADAGRILSRRFHLVVTNVPYLARGRQSSKLQDFADQYHQDARADLATMMIDRCWHGCGPSGTVAVVAPQNWSFLASYKTFRLRTLSEWSWQVVAKLGPGAFETITGEVVNVALFALSRRQPPDGTPLLGIDATDATSASGKAKLLRAGELAATTQDEQRRNPDGRIVLSALDRGTLLNAVAQAFQGLKSGDDPRYRRFHWEVANLTGRWRRLQSTVSTTTPFGGMESVVDWRDDGAAMARRQGLSAWGHQGVAVSQMSALGCTRYLGQAFDSNVCPVVPAHAADLPALWAYFESGEFQPAVRLLDQKMAVANATVVKVPFDVAKWRKAAAAAYPNGLPEPDSDDPTQWLFKGTPRRSQSPLHVAVARLLGYRWPDQQPDALDAHADNDGIVCLPALRGERPAADRLADLLAAAWGKDWHPQTLTDLLAAVGHQGTLEEWLRDAFFKQHCELFHHRPFHWQTWDGHREGFSAIVNYHKLDHEGLKSLTYSYLGDWIRDQESEAKAGKSGAGDKLAKAKTLQQRLAVILEGEAPLDIFVRWKPIEQQPVGWHPDLDDGVRLNIRPFLTVADVGAKGAGVLRWKPNIKWGIDRGKNPPGSPWGEDRDNDKHLTLAQKRAARGQ